MVSRRDAANVASKERELSETSSFSGCCHEKTSSTAQAEIEKEASKCCDISFDLLMVRTSSEKQVERRNHLRTQVRKRARQTV